MMAYRVTLPQLRCKSAVCGAKLPCVTELGRRNAIGHHFAAQRRRSKFISQQNPQMLYEAVLALITT